MSIVHGLLLWLVFPAQGGNPRVRGDQSLEDLEDKIESGPSASAAEIVPLAKLLQKSGWTATPELSGVFQAGAIFEASDSHTLLADGCIEREPVESTYTAAEVVSSLQAGVRVKLGVGSLRGEGELVKRVKFATPSQFSIPTIDLTLTDSCRSKLAALPDAQIDRSYIVREVLRAVIAEQTCGVVGADGRIVGLGAANAEFAAACSQESLEPVAVGFRTVALRDLLSSDLASGRTPPSSQRTPEATLVLAPSTPPTPVLSTGPFILVFRLDGARCTWSIEDAPTGRSTTIFASGACPDEVSWVGTDSLYYNDGEQFFSLRSGDPTPTPIPRPTDAQCDAETGWGTPHRLADGGLQWSCVSEVTQQTDLGGGRTKLCSGAICTDEEDGIWSLAIPVLVKTYFRPAEGEWRLDSVAADCSGTELCLMSFDRPPDGDVQGVSLARLYRRARDLALEGTAPEAVTTDPSVAAMLGLDGEFSWIQGATLGATRHILWSRHAETVDAYGPAVVVETSGLRRYPLDLPEGRPLVVTAENGWAVLDPYDEESSAVLIGATGEVPARSWPPSARVILLPEGTTPPLGIIPKQR